MKNGLIKKKPTEEKTVYRDVAGFPKQPTNYKNRSSSVNEFEQKAINEKFYFAAPKRQQLKRQSSDFLVAENQMDIKITIKRKKQEETKKQLEAELQKKYTTT